ncbi:3-prime overlapp with BBM_01g00535 [Babesia microti strain RI]|uniref:3-prime overlapp with BBM_01g00535 n=1 Tax=Babesia microti (strain RI) TaxID=1133968 RepID=A0A1N6LWD5_BABMR|nr:3-prime overlapp with BBM_01g00535 [Babesia microti strain RI]SIO73182.1 3-prime overlapp with BBM_01g00535 [Babesia microti strain RI]|eukprot:XP_021337290.1 3-prime overlapp with BBM_01g00535 [Babesia microti strain RI]
MILKRYFSHNIHVKAPENAGVVFSSGVTPMRFTLDFKQWIFICMCGFSGAFSGNIFYNKFMLNKNPPNPSRNPNETPPESHPHTPED